MCRSANRAASASQSVVARPHWHGHGHRDGLEPLRVGPTSAILLGNRADGRRALLLRLGARAAPARSAAAAASRLVRPRRPGVGAGRRRRRMIGLRRCLRPVLRPGSAAPASTATISVFGSIALAAPAACMAATSIRVAAAPAGLLRTGPGADGTSTSTDVAGAEDLLAPRWPSARHQGHDIVLPARLRIGSPVRAAHPGARIAALGVGQLIPNVRAVPAATTSRLAMRCGRPRKRRRGATSLFGSRQRFTPHTGAVVACVARCWMRSCARKVGPHATGTR